MNRLNIHLELAPCSYNSKTVILLFFFKFNFDVTPLYIHCLIPSWGFVFIFVLKHFFVYSLVFWITIHLYHYILITSGRTIYCCITWNIFLSRHAFTSEKWPKYFQIFVFVFLLLWIFSSRFLVNEKFNQKLVCLQVIKLNRGCWLFYNTCAY